MPAALNNPIADLLLVLADQILDVDLLRAFSARSDPDTCAEVAVLLPFGRKVLIGTQRPTAKVQRGIYSVSSRSNVSGRRRSVS